MNKAYNDLAENLKNFLQENGGLEETHTLSLKDFDFDIKALSRAKLIKTPKLETLLEIFENDVSGSAYYRPDQLDYIFDTVEEEGKTEKDRRDQKSLIELAMLPSYDFFSLKLFLGEDSEHISEETKILKNPFDEEMLDQILKLYFEPLFEMLLGEKYPKNVSTQLLLTTICSADDLKSSRDKINLQQLKNIDNISDLVELIKNYADVFLAISYLSARFDLINEDMHYILRWLHDITRDRDIVKNTRQTVQHYKAVEKQVHQILFDTRNILDGLHLSFITLWTNQYSSQELFKFYDDIIEHYIDLSGLICGLEIKTHTWQNMFPSGHDTVTPARRSEFLWKYLTPGLDNLTKWTQILQSLKPLD